MMNRGLTCTASGNSSLTLGKYCIPGSGAAEHVLNCLHTGISIKNEIKMKIYTKHTPKIGNGLVQFIRMEKSTVQIWIVNACKKQMAETPCRHTVI